MASTSSHHRRQMSFNSYNATVMDLHIAAATIQASWRRWSAKAKLQTKLTGKSSAESLGALLVSMTTELASLRMLTGELESKNRRLFQELEALQHEKLDLRARSASEEKRLADEIASLRAIIHSHLDGVDPAAHPVELLVSVAVSSPESRLAEEPEEDQVDRKYWRQAALAAQADATAAKTRARDAEAKLSELHALHSMQVDECKGLQAKLVQARLAAVESDERLTALQDQYDQMYTHAEDVQEQLRRSHVEAQSQYTHWMQTQTDLHAVQAERDELANDVARLREANDGLRQDSDRLHAAQDEVAALKRAINGLKGTVTAKTAEAKAFQAYGASAREHLHTQGVQLQHLTQFQNKFRSVGSVAMAVLRGLKVASLDARDVLVTWQSEMASTVALLQTKLATACQFVQMAHIEHKLLRHALVGTTASAGHLHDQLWKAHRNALFVCQVLTMDDASMGNNPDPPGPRHHRITANFETGDVLHTSPDTASVKVQFDQVYSNRGRGWSTPESVGPAIQSVLSGKNACVVTFEGQPCIELASEDGAPSSATAAVLDHLFRECTALLGFASVQCTLSYLGIYSEHVYDLLTIVDDTPTSDCVHGGFADACCAPTSSNNHQPMVVLDIRDARDAQIAVAEGFKNLARLIRRFPTMEHLTHRLLTVCVTVVPAFTSDGGGSSHVTKSKLQIVELAAGDGGRECTWQDTERIRATISAENSLQAFTTCLGAIRQPSSDHGESAMRYHASKLTLLLQDCLQEEAKLLVLCTFATTDDKEPWRGLRTMQMLHLFRDAVAPSKNNSSRHEDDTDAASALPYGAVTWHPPAPAHDAQGQPWEVELDAIKGRNALMAPTIDVVCPVASPAQQPSPPGRGNNNHPTPAHQSPPLDKGASRKAVKLSASRRSLKASLQHMTTSSALPLASTLLSAPPHATHPTKRLPFR